MFGYKSDNFKALKARGSVIVLFSLLLPFFMLMAAFGIDIGLIYYQRDRLQAVADAAALAGGQIRADQYNEVSGRISLTSTDEQCREAAEGIMHQICDYINANGLELADADENDDEEFKQEGKALQFTNFMNENFVSTYKQDVYDGPTIANKKENYDKVAVQCGIPSNATDRVRVRLRKLVPTVMLGSFLGLDAYPITVVAASSPQRPPAEFRLVGMHGVYLNYVDLVSSNINSNKTEGYIDGDVYAGDMICCTSAASVIANDDIDSWEKGYGAGSFTLKGKLFTRSFSTGSPGKDMDKYQELFAKVKGEYLYEKPIYKDGKLYDMKYAVESKVRDDTDGPEGWRHAYNLSRLMNWERFRIYDEGVGDFIPLYAHKLRLAIAPQKEKEEFREATAKVRKQRKQYRQEMEALYMEALQNLCPGLPPDQCTKEKKLKNTDTEWRYLYCGKNDKDAASVCSIKASDNEKSIRLLVEISGVDTTATSGWNKDNGGVAWLTNGNFTDGNAALPDGITKLNIEKMVVVITGDKNGKSRSIDESRLENGTKSILLDNKNGNMPQTGALIICPTKKENFIGNYQEITFGDIYSEANVAFYGKLLNFNGVTFSEKALVFPTPAYGTHSASTMNTHHIFSGSSTILGNYVIFGYNYLPATVKGINNDGKDNTNTLSAGLDYPITYFDHRVSCKTANAYGIVPMHTQLVGLTDDEYQAAVFEEDEDDDIQKDHEEDDPMTWTIKEYNEEYTYHWFNPNFEYTFLSTEKAEELTNNNFLTHNNKGSGKRDYENPSAAQLPTNTLWSYDVNINTTDGKEQLNNALEKIVDFSQVDSTGQNKLVPFYKHNELDVMAWYKNLVTSTSNPKYANMKYYQHIFGCVNSDVTEKIGNQNSYKLFAGHVDSKYPYFAAPYDVTANGAKLTNDKYYKLLTLSEVPEGRNTIVGLHSARYNNDNTDINAYNNDVFYTVYVDDPDESKKPTVKDAKIANYLGASDYYLNSKVKPWYMCYNTKYSPYIYSLMDVNKVNMDIRLLCLAASGNADPFAYNPEYNVRKKLLTYVKGVDMANKNTFYPAQTYRVAYDLDMQIKYLIDQIVYIGSTGTEFPTKVYPDGGAARTYDIDSQKPGYFGTAPSRYSGGEDKASEKVEGGSPSSDLKLHMSKHVFGLKSDPAYTSIRLVE